MDPEVGKRPEKRPTPATGVSALSSGPHFPITHPPLGERKSVSSSSAAPNITSAFAQLKGGSQMFPGPVTAAVVKCRGSKLLSGWAKSLRVVRPRGDPELEKVEQRQMRRRAPSDARPRQPSEGVEFLVSERGLVR